MITNCPVCACNAANGSIAKTYEMSYEIIESIFNLIDSIQNSFSEDDSGYLGLLSPCLGVLVEMSNKLFVADDFQTLNFASSTRVVIERFSDLMYINEKGTLKYKKFNDLFLDNSLDIFDICTASSGTEISNKWLSQRWTGLKREKRIAYFGDDEFLIAYGYASRIVHGVNRDYKFKNQCDAVLVRYYFFLVSNMAMCAAVKGLPIKYISADISGKASILYELVNYEWESNGMRIRNILNLSTFSTYFSNPKQQVFLEDLRIKIMEAYNQHTFPSFEIINHVHSQDNIQEKEAA